MSITPIGDASALADQLVSNLTQVKQTSGTSGDFKSVWNDQAASASANGSGSDLPLSANRDNGNRNDNVKDTSENVNKDRTVDPADKTDEASKTDVKGKDRPEKSESVKTDNTDGKMLKDEEIESATEVLATILADLEVKIADILNMDPEEFNALLEDTFEDPFALLNKEDLSAFVLKALGADSELSLITSEEDYAKFSESLNALTEVLGTETPIRDMNVSELVTAVEASVEISDEEPMVAEGTVSREEVPEIRNEDRTAARFVRNSNGDLERVDVTESGAETGEAKIVRTAPEAQKQSRDTDKGSENHQPGAAVNTDTAGQVQVAGTEAAESAAPESYVSDPQQIADQILDHMKTVTDGDFSDVEMQLHPASLGTVQIHVTNNAGVITASFVTENEAVKAAVESQIVRLNEQLEAQGIRVEAIEVTVASHSFEGNLESGNRETSEGSGNGRRRTRRINLDSESGEPDTSSMEEEERIAAEMMAANGNKVDYTA